MISSVFSVHWRCMISIQWIEEGLSMLKGFKGVFSNKLCPHWIVPTTLFTVFLLLAICWEDMNWFDSLKRSYDNIGFNFIIFHNIIHLWFSSFFSFFSVQWFLETLKLLNWFDMTIDYILGQQGKCWLSLAYCYFFMGNQSPLALSSSYLLL